MSTPKQVVDLTGKAGVKMVNVKVVDAVGSWQHFTVPAGELTTEVFTDGFGFDESSMRGWKSIEVSDMLALALPDPGSAFVDPFMADPTFSLTCTIAEAGPKEPCRRDPRGIASRAEIYLKSTKIADTAYFGREAEFFNFDKAQCGRRANRTFCSVDSEEAIGNSGRHEMPNFGHKIRHKEGDLPVSPADIFQELRAEMVLMMEQLGIKVERQYPKWASPGRQRLIFDLKPCSCTPTR